MSDLDEKSEKEIRLEYLEALRFAAYQSFNDRRSYEWKLSLAIWTAIAVLVAGLVPTRSKGHSVSISRHTLRSLRNYHWGRHFGTARLFQ